MSGEAKKIQVRLQNAQKVQQSLQVQVSQLTAETAKATGDKKEALQDQLDLAQSSLDLADDEVEDAEEDLADVGGDRRGRIAQLKQSHENAERAKGAETKFPQESAEQLGLVHRFQLWSALRQKMLLLQKAKSEADTAATAAMMQHNDLAEQIEKEKQNSPDLAAHAARVLL